MTMGCASPHKKGSKVFKQWGQPCNSMGVTKTHDNMHLRVSQQHAPSLVAATVSPAPASAPICITQGTSGSGCNSSSSSSTSSGSWAGCVFPVGVAGHRACSSHRPRHVLPGWPLVCDIKIIGIMNCDQGGRGTRGDGVSRREAGTAEGCGVWGVGCGVLRE